MIAHILPLLVAAGIGANARALPVAQGVTEILTPGAAPGQCMLTVPSTFGIRTAPIGVAPLRKRQDVTQIADGQLQAINNAAFAGANAFDANIAVAQGAMVPELGNIAAANVMVPELGNIAAANVMVPELGNIAAANVMVPENLAAAPVGFGSVTQIYDGQIQAPGSVAQAQAQALAGPAYGLGSASVSQIYDGQIQAPGFINQVQDVIPVNQIYDGQIQAMAQVPGQFGASVLNMAPVNQIYDGQIQAIARVPEQFGASVVSMAPAGLDFGTVTQIYDGQLQAANQLYGARVETLAPVNQIYDGQIQAMAQVPGQFGASVLNMAPVNQIYDGQIQAVAQVPGQFVNMAPVNQIYDGQIQAMAQVPGQFGASVVNMAPAGLDFGAVTQIYDGQIQAPSLLAQAQAVGPIPQAYGAQAQAFGLAPEVVSTPNVPLTPEEAAYSTNQVTQIMDGQIQAPAEALQQPNFPAQVDQGPAGQVPQSPSAITPQSPAVGDIPMTQIADGQVQVKRSLKARQNGPPALLSLNNGVLTDNLGRTGYIAANRQLQFDAPPQTGAIYTAGFSACNDGSLALGGSNTFYACGSSDFNNLYDQAVNANCNPVKLYVN